MILGLFLQPFAVKAEQTVICTDDDGQFVLILSETEMHIPSKYQRFEIIDKDQYATYGKSLGYGVLAVYSKSENELLLMQLFARSFYIKARCDR